MAALEKSERRRIGVDNLNARGLTKGEIAKEIKTNVVTLRGLLRPGRGKRSLVGIRLDRFLEEHRAFDRELLNKPARASKRLAGGMMREDLAPYRPRREINLPSPSQIEELRLIARRASSPHLEEEIASMEAELLAIREQCDTVETRFIDLLSRAQAGAA